ncbi:uncharacterized protein [Procambarus clarkii]|uniref:uncharacterized protein isoform X2 n=1 Tax=Procambarus clarkii TaxID=6728 RepID=UPI001E677748|nr:uncharacterized protein LOC123746070 isoform X2 [Procambarus clarkii]
MRMDGAEDISTLAQRRQAGRHVPRAHYPSDLTLHIDNFTSGNPSPTHSPPIPRKYEPKGFLAEVVNDRRREVKVSLPLFLEEVPYNRIYLPPLVPVEVHGTEVAALIHTASHISLVSSTLVQDMGVRQDVLPDTSVPPSPLGTGTASPWLVEGKLRYVELSIKGSKHVTQLHVARDLPADLVLGVDFLKKAQVRLSFPENAISLPHGKGEVKVAFLSSKEMNQHQRRPNNPSTSINKTRAYSSNY